MLLGGALLLANPPLGLAVQYGKSKELRERERLKGEGDIIADAKDAINDLLGRETEKANSIEITDKLAHMEATGSAYNQARGKQKGMFAKNMVNGALTVYMKGRNLAMQMMRNGYGMQVDAPPGCSHGGPGGPSFG